MEPAIILAFIGLFLSLYAYRVKKNLERYPQYKPVCDLSNRVSCSKAFSSKEARLFFWPNSVWGMFYYFLLILFFENFQYLLALILASAGLAVSVYFAYILYFKQKNFCVVCWATHALNLAIFVKTLYLIF